MNIIVAPEGKFAGICKIADIVLIVILAVFFVMTFLTYYDYADGDVIDLGNGETMTVKETEDDTAQFSLLAYSGFPAKHTLVNQYYKAAFGEKTISIKQVGMILALDVFGLLGILFLIIKKGIVRAIYCCLWGITGILGFTMNNMLLLGNTFVKPACLVLCIAAAAVGLVASVMYGIDVRAKYAYLRSVSAAYK